MAGLDYSFGETQVLHGISLEVAPGESVALVGPSGSGKSTLLYCLAGLLVPQAGRVDILGSTISQASEADRSRVRLAQMGLVFQFGELVPELTLADNISLPLEARGVSRKRAKARAAELCERLDLVAAAGRTPDRVSGGQVQRAAVARAIVGSPPIVFADEPTGSLDTANGEVVIDMLFRCVQETGAALVLVTHDERIASRCQRRLTLVDGAIVSEAVGAVSAVGPSAP